MRLGEKLMLRRLATVTRATASAAAATDSAGASTRTTHGAIWPWGKGVWYPSISSARAAI